MLSLDGPHGLADGAVQPPVQPPAPRVVHARLRTTIAGGKASVTVDWTVASVITWTTLGPSASASASAGARARARASVCDIRRPRGVDDRVVRREATTPATSCSFGHSCGAVWRIYMLSSVLLHVGCGVCVAASVYRRCRRDV